MQNLIDRHAAINAIHEVILGLFDFTDDNFEEPMTYTEEKFLHINKLITSRIKELPSAQPEQRWIPVTERLPEIDGYYLVTKKTFGWNGEQYFEVDIARYERKNGWAKHDECIAWRELPEPFRKETKDAVR